MGRFRVVVGGLCLAALGCGPSAAGGDAAADAAADAVTDASGDAFVDPACQDLVEGMACDHGAPFNAKASCQGGRCLPGCQGDPTRTPCNTFYDRPKSCCGADEQCCWVGWEAVGCRPGEVPCPRICAFQSPIQWECPADLFCVYEYEHPESMPPDGTCPDVVSGQWWTGRRCEADCPAERRCGDDCCGVNTRCLEVSGTPCCVASRPDAGTGDAGADDAGADDAGVGDATGGADGA